GGVSSLGERRLVPAVSARPQERGRFHPQRRGGEDRAGGEGRSHESRRCGEDRSREGEGGGREGEGRGREGRCGGEVRRVSRGEKAGTYPPRPPTCQLFARFFARRSPKVQGATGAPRARPPDRRRTGVTATSSASPRPPRASQAPQRA